MQGKFGSYQNNLGKNSTNNINKTIYAKNHQKEKSLPKNLFSPDSQKAEGIKTLTKQSIFYI
jgi:hypothetical protein